MFSDAHGELAPLVFERLHLRLTTRVPHSEVPAHKQTVSQWYTRLTTLINGSILLGARAATVSCVRTSWDIHTESGTDSAVQPCCTDHGHADLLSSLRQKTKTGVRYISFYTSLTENSHEINRHKWHIILPQARSFPEPSLVPLLFSAAAPKIPKTRLRWNILNTQLTYCVNAVCFIRYCRSVSSWICDHLPASFLACFLLLAYPVP